MPPTPPAAARLHSLSLSLTRVPAGTQADTSVLRTVASAPPVDVSAPPASSTEPNTTSPPRADADAVSPPTVSSSLRPNDPIPHDTARHGVDHEPLESHQPRRDRAAQLSHLSDEGSYSAMRREEAARQTLVDALAAAVEVHASVHS